LLEEEEQGLVGPMASHMMDDHLSWLVGRCHHVRAGVWEKYDYYSALEDFQV
jgi:hypothetical protein